MDPETLCNLAASCESARRIDDTHYEGVVVARLGFAQVRARVFGEVLEAQEPRVLVIALSGETMGMPGSFHGVAHLDMNDVAEGTLADYTFDMTLLGRLDTLGKPFLQPMAQKLASTFARKVSRYLAERRV